MACKVDNTVGELFEVDSKKGESGARTNYSDRTFPVLQLTGIDISWHNSSDTLECRVWDAAFTIESVALSEPTDKESIDIAAGRDNLIRTD